jgi:hypothetical protein
VGLNLWNKAVEMGSLGRELHLELVGESLTEEQLLNLVAIERPSAAPLKLLSRFRPPIEAFEPVVFMAMQLTETGYAPLGLTYKQKEDLEKFLSENPSLLLIPSEDAAYFKAGSRKKKGHVPSRDESPWERYAAQAARGKPPYSVSKGVLELPASSWMKHTAELFGMLPLKWEDGGGFFQGSPSSATWGDVLRAVAPSQEIEGESTGLFPVPILASSLLDSVISAHRQEFFLTHETKTPLRHVCICGPTGTGKTLLGTFALINTALEGKAPVMYLGPTRMLVEDAALEFVRVLSNLEKEAGGNTLLPRKDILVSTGETFFDDGRLALGDFKAAFVVYEKVSNFFLSSDLIRHLSLALVDELHMIGDRVRGGPLDATLARLLVEARRRIAKKEPPLRLMCLSTGAMAGDKCLLELMDLAGASKKAAMKAENQAQKSAPLLPGVSAINRQGPSSDPPEAPLRERKEQKGPLVLSVYGRPQRLLTYIQPTSQSNRFRPFHVERIFEASLASEDFILDRVPGVSFQRTLDGWLPGHAKVIYASYSAGSLSSFAMRAMEFGRGKVPEIQEDSFFLEDLYVSLTRSGAKDKNIEFYMKAASCGIFFHFSVLGRDTRRLMADAFRRFTPLPYEPFILCATETISYGVNLPADALFLEDVNWPRSRYKNSYNREPLTTNEFRNLVGRVGRHGHIKVGIIPTVIVNWALGKAAHSPEIFSQKREELASICSSAPVLTIDCHQLQKYLIVKPTKFLTDYPGPVGRFFQLGLLHASALKGGRAVTAKEVASFLTNTYTVKSFLMEEPESRATSFTQNLSQYFSILKKSFGDKVLTAHWRGEDFVYEPMELCLNLARNDTSPLTLRELDKLLEGFGKNSPWLGKDLYGLATLVLVTLVTENKDIFTRIFIDPRSIKPSYLKKARVEPSHEKEYFQKKSGPVALYLEKMGVEKAEVDELLRHVKKAIYFLVMNHLKNNFRPAANDQNVVATMRDALTQRVMVIILTLLMWVDGVTVKTILDRIGTRFQGLTMEDLGQEKTLELDNNGEIDPGGAALEDYLMGPGKSSVTLDYQSFPYRYCDKVALLLDSYMVYGNLTKNSTPEESSSLEDMAQRVRYGMKSEDITLFLSQVRDTRQFREEWLIKKLRQ